MGIDFYEDDEPIEAIAAAFGTGPHPVTQAPPLPGGAVLVVPPQTFAQTVSPRDTPFAPSRPQLQTV